MNKLFSALFASMMIVATSGFAVQNESPMTQQDAQPATETQRAPYEPGDLLVSEEEQKYFVALTKCESLGGSQKAACIEVAIQEFDGGDIRYAMVKAG